MAQRSPVSDRTLAWALGASLLAVTMALPSLLVGCGVDGKTPDCSTPDKGCGPLVDGSTFFENQDGASPEGGNADGATSAETSTDAASAGDARDGGGDGAAEGGSDAGNG